MGSKARSLKATVELPRGRSWETGLHLGDSVGLFNPGEPDPVVTVRRVGKNHIVITVRPDDERLTAADLDLLGREPVDELIEAGRALAGDEVTENAKAFLKEDR
jgi:hypothetical protein